MSARQTTSLSVRSSDDLERAEREIRNSDLDAIEIETPEGASALLVAGEVRRLMHAARESETQLTFITDDPLRKELVLILGGNVRSSCDPSDRKHLLAEEDHSGDLTRRIHYASVDVRRNERGPFEQTGQIEKDDPSYSFVITPPITYRTPEASARRPVHVETSHLAPHAGTTDRAHHRGLFAGSLVAVLTLAVVGGLLALYLIPSATVTITPLVSEVSVEITYGVAVPGANWDVQVQPTAVDQLLTATATIATSGERFEPDGSAAGSLRLTNASTSEALVQAGTRVATDAGIAFVTVEDVVVPAADPFGTLTFGSATVDIRASAAGPEGNVDTEDIVGQLEGGVFFTNLNPTVGGTNRRIATVSQRDIDALGAQVTADLNNSASSALTSELAPGQQLLAGSEARDAVALVYDLAIGTDATELRADGSLHISALAYSIEELHDAAVERLPGELVDQAGNEVVVLPDSMALGDPQLVSNAVAPAFRIEATARVQSVIDDDAVEQLPDQIASESLADAQLAAATVPGVGSVEIEKTPDWYPFGMPRRASRIEVVVVQRPADSSTTQSSSSTGP